MVCARRTRLVAATATVATLATAVATIAARLAGLRVGHGARRLLEYSLARKHNHHTPAPSLAVACCVECAFSVIGALLPGVTEEYARDVKILAETLAWAGALLGVTGS